MLCLAFVASVVVVVINARPHRARGNATAPRLPKRQWCFEKEKLLAAAKSEEVILVTASFDYRGVLLNWLVAMELATKEIDRVVLLCLDREVAKFLEGIGLSCVACDVAETKSRHQRHGRIWLSRVHALSLFLETKKNVTLSDLDAIWLQNPRAHLNTADLVASRGSFPKWASDKWGAAACMGFIRFNAPTFDFVHRIVLREIYARGFDDQLAINAALHKAALRWPALLAYVDSADLDRGKTGRPPLSVAFLPHSRFVRICPDDETSDQTIIPKRKLSDDLVVVKHCYTQKTVNSKEVSLGRRGLWFLVDDWESRLKAPDLPRPAVAPHDGHRRSFFSNVVLPRVLHHPS